MYAKGNSHFLDNSLRDIKRVAGELLSSNPKLANDLLMDYKQGTLDEAGGLLFNAKRTGPRYNQSTGKLIKGSDRIEFSRNSYKDLPLQDQIRVLRDNISGYDALIDSTQLSDSQLQAKLKPHNPNKLIYDDLITILAESADSKTGIYQGPGQVGSPSRDGGKQFTRDEALPNAAQFLTEPPTDRLLGTHVSFAQQGHTLDAKNYPSLARDINYMRAQQGEPNRRDGAAAKGLVNMTREDNLKIGRQNDMESLLELIDERLSQDITETEAANLIDLAMEIQGKPKVRHAGDAIRLLVSGSTRDDSPGNNIESGRDTQASGLVAGEKPTVINAGEGSRVYVEAGNGNGNGSKAEKIKAILKNGNGHNGNGKY